MRQLSKADLALKDMSIMRENDKTRDQKDKGHYDIRDLSLQHRVKIYKDLNADAERDRIFKLTVDNYEVILDAEQVSRAIRWV